MYCCWIARIDIVDRLVVVLVSEVYEISHRRYQLSRQLMFEGNIQAIVVGLLEILRIPEYRRAAPADVCSPGLARNRNQRIAGGIGIVDRLLRDAVQ